MVLILFCPIENIVQNLCQEIFLDFGSKFVGLHKISIFRTEFVQFNPPIFFYCIIGINLHTQRFLKKTRNLESGDDFLRALTHKY